MKSTFGLLLSAIVLRVESLNAAEDALLRPALVRQQQLQQPAGLLQRDPPQVAAAAELNADGFPILPDVSKMLSPAQRTLQGLTEEAASLQARVEKAQAEKASKMGQQKAAFEGKLKAQELENRALVAQNKAVVKEIGQLQSSNADIRSHTKQLQDTNKIMRGELLTLQSKLVVGQSFLGKSLETTDDSNAADLVVLSPEGAAAPDGNTPLQREQPPPSMASVSQVPLAASPVPPPHRKALTEVQRVAEDADADRVDVDDKDEEDEDDEPGAVSLLVVGERRSQAPGGGPLSQAESDAHGLIKVLQGSVAALAEQEHEGEAQLKALFVKTFKAGAQHHQALAAQQKTLNATRASLTALQTKLRKAEAHLEATGKDLSQRLQGFGLFLQKLGHLALAPSAEASRLEQALPTGIAVAGMPVAGASAETPVAGVAAETLAASAAADAAMAAL